jgi:Lipocalin-like domain
MPMPALPDNPLPDNPLPDNPLPDNPLLGTWQLISAIAMQPDGTLDPAVYGAHPTGYLTYTADGHMMVMLARRDRESFSREVSSPLSRELHDLPIAELAQAFTTFNAYAGTYTGDGNTVKHQIAIAAIPNRVGTTLVRTFTRYDQRLTLRTVPVVRAGVESIFELVWEHV